MESDETARRIPDPAKIAQYRFMEKERKSTEKAMIATIATTAEAKVTGDDPEKMKKPATMVNNLPVSEYGASTRACSFEYAYCPATFAIVTAEEANTARNKTDPRPYGEKSTPVSGTEAVNGENMTARTIMMSAAITLLKKERKNGDAFMETPSAIALWYAKVLNTERTEETIPQNMREKKNYPRATRLRFISMVCS